MPHNFLVIGESCQDIFQYGSSKRLSPEAPVPVFIPHSSVHRGGMAKNVYNNLLAIIKKENVNDSVYHIFSRNEAIKTRFVDIKTNHYFIRVDEYDNLYEQIDISPEQEAKIKKADCILISDYNKGFLSSDDIIKICTLAQKNCLIILDTKKKVKVFLDYVNFIKINNIEYLENVEKGDISIHANKIIVTMGENGTFYNGINFPSPSPHTTIDLSGAGDTFMAALCYKYLKTTSISDAIDFANYISSIVVTKKGVATI